MRKARQAFTLGTFLVLSAILLASALVLAGLVTMRLQLTNNRTANDQALYLAEGALARLLSDLHQHHDFGSHREQVVFPDGATDPNQRGTISFDPKAAIPYSTNDVGGGHGTGWNATAVPEGSVHAVAVGQCGGVRVTLETMLGVPEYPYVVSSDGDLSCTGGIIVQGSSSMAAFVAEEQKSKPHPLPASIGDNGSISADGTTSISGDVVAPVAVKLPSDAYVGGTIRTSMIDVPNVDLTQYSTKTVPNVHIPTASELSGGLTVDRQMYFKGLLHSPSLTFNHGVLYVDGDLNVPGGVSGQGALIVNGATTLGGSVKLDAANLVALLSEGDVTLTGTGSGAVFQGLVYTHGSFHASQVTIAGTFVAARGPSGEGDVELSSARVVHVPGTADINITNSKPFGITGTFMPPQPPYDYYACSLNVGNPPTEHPLISKAVMQAAAGLPANQQSCLDLHDTNGNLPIDTAYIPPISGPAVLDPSTGMDTAPGHNYMDYTIIAHNATTGKYEVIPGQVLGYYSVNRYMGRNMPEPYLSVDYFTSQATAAGVDPMAMENALATIQAAVVQGANQEIAQQSIFSIDLNTFLRDTWPLQVLNWRQI